MTRDHKLILGGALGGIAGCVFALGLYLIAVGLLVSGGLLVAGAGRG